MRPAGFRAAVFDMDGLLLDSERPIRTAWLAAAREFGVTLGEADYGCVVGCNEVDSRLRLQDLLGPALAYDAVRARAEVLLEAAIGPAGYALKAGVVALLERLQQRGVPCVVASSTHRGEVARRIAQAGLARFFCGLNGGDEVRRGKPHPDLFLLAADRLGHPPGECLVFEDSPQGARGALAAGMSVVVVPDLAQPPDDARAACLAVLESLHEARRRLDEWFPLAPGV